MYNTIISHTKERDKSNVGRVDYTGIGINLAYFKVRLKRGICISPIKQQQTLHIVESHYTIMNKRANVRKNEVVIRSLLIIWRVRTT